MIAWDNRCQRCHKKKKILHVHHRDCCPLNWQIENLMLLCPKCHTKSQGKILSKPNPVVVASYKIAGRIGHLVPNLSINIVANNLRKNQNERLARVAV